MRGTQSFRTFLQVTSNCWPRIHCIVIDCVFSYRNKVKYLNYLRKRCNVNPARGPFHFRAPCRIFFKAVRGEFIWQFFIFFLNFAMIQCDEQTSYLHYLNEQCNEITICNLNRSIEQLLLCNYPLYLPIRYQRFKFRILIFCLQFLFPPFKEWSHTRQSVVRLPSSVWESLMVSHQITKRNVVFVYHPPCVCYRYVPDENSVKWVASRMKWAGTTRMSYRIWSERGKPSCVFIWNKWKWIIS